MTTDAADKAAVDVEDEGDDAEEDENEDMGADVEETKAEPKYTPYEYLHKTLDGVNARGVEESCKVMQGVVIQPQNPFLAALRRGGDGSDFSEADFHHPALALVDPPAFCDVQMPCPNYGWEHAQHCHRRYKKPKFLRPRCVRFPGNVRLYVSSCQWVCDECVREKAVAKLDCEKETNVEKKKELEVVWKTKKCTFMAYNEKVFEAFLSNPETAFIPLCLYPYVDVTGDMNKRERDAHMIQKLWRCGGGVGKVE